MSTDRPKFKDGVCQRGSDVWLIKYYAGKNEQGKWLQRYATVHGKRKDALAKRRELMSNVDKGTHVDRSKVTVAEWLESRLAVSKGAAKTVERYRELGRYISARLGSVEIQQLTSSQIEQFYAWLEREGGKNGAPLSPKTVKHVHTLLRGVVNAARRRNIIARNPFDELTKDELPSNADSLAVPFEPGELATLLTSLARDNDALLPLVRLALQTGMRRGELLALRWGAVDVEKRTIHVREALEEIRKHSPRAKVPKTKSGIRSILISDSAAAELRAHWKDCAEMALKCGQRLTGESLVFPQSPAEPDTPRRPRSVSEAFSDRLKKFGIKRPKLSFHALRHTHASIMLRSGNVSIIAAAKRLGHAKPSITLDIYGHLMPGDEQQAVAVVDQFFRNAATV